MDQRLDADRLDVTERHRHRVLPTHRDHLAGLDRVGAEHVRLDPHRVPGHRQHPAARPHHGRGVVQRGDRVGEHLHQAEQQHVADRMAGQRIRPGPRGEPVLQQGGTALIGGAVGGQRGERLAQVARGQQGVPLGPQPATRAAVVADRDDRGDLQVEVSLAVPQAAQ